MVPRTHSPLCRPMSHIHQGLSKWRHGTARQSQQGLESRRISATSQFREGHRGQCYRCCSDGKKYYLIIAVYEAARTLLNSKRNVCKSPLDKWIVEVKAPSSVRQPSLAGPTLMEERYLSMLHQLPVLHPRQAWTSPGTTGKELPSRA